MAWEDKLDSCCFNIMNTYQLLADLVLLVHFLYVLGVLLPVPLILAGKIRGWFWVRNRWFRGIHLLMVLIVVVMAIFDIVCPLTTWEDQLRVKAGMEGYGGSFVEYWITRILFYDFEPWVFELMYTVFSLIIIALFIWVPPNWKIKSDSSSSS